MSARTRGALFPIPLLLLAACGGGSSTSSVNPTANDPKPATYARFDPTSSDIPLPNVLATAAVTSTLTPTAGVPLTPDKALVWLNQKEAGGTNAVSGVNAPIYLSFSAQVDPSTVTASSVKVFQVLPDSPSNPSSTENNTLGFRDVSAQFSYQVLPFVSGISTGTELYLMPQVPMLPGARYLYVVTDAVKDTNGAAVTPSGIFKDLEYVKAGGTSYANDTTNLADTSDPNNPAGILGPSLEPICANVVVSTQVAFSGYRKVMWDLIANATSDVSGQTAYGAGPTGISSRSQIAVLGRTITTGVGYTKPDPVGSPSTLAPLETLMYAWANNASYFSTSASRTWNNGVSNFAVIGSSVVPSGAGSVAAIFGSIPHSSVGLVAWGSFQSADIQMDPAVVLANLAVAGGNEDGVSGVYNPGTSTVPGSNTLMQFRDSGGVLRGWYHQTRTVPFVLIVPVTSSATTWPVVIFQHGIGRSKEDALAMANSACAAGYAVISIDQAVHGFPGGVAGSLTPTAITTGMGNGQPQSDWASNFFMLPSTLTARANIYDSAFNLWRLERILNQPSADPSSLTAQLASATASASSFPYSAQASLNTGATTHRFVGQSLGSIAGTVFLAGNSGATGGSNMPGFLSVPGARLAFVLRDSPAFQSAVNAGLAANGVATGSVTYNQFFVLAQSVADSVDPASLLTPLLSGGSATARFYNRLAVQEAVGDTVIPNSNGNYWGNALGGRTPQFGADVSGGFTQVLNSGQSSPALPFMFGSSYSSFKAAVAPASGSATTPKQGVYQYGTTSTAATHGLLLDGSSNTAAAQTQMARWLATGLITDGSVAYPIAPGATSESVPAAELFGPENLQMFFPKAQ